MFVFSLDEMMIIILLGNAVNCCDASIWKKVIVDCNFALFCSEILIMVGIVECQHRNVYPLARANTFDPSLSVDYIRYRWNHCFACAYFFCACWRHVKRRNSALALWQVQYLPPHGMRRMVVRIFEKYSGQRSKISRNIVADAISTLVRRAVFGFGFLELLLVLDQL